eukprot:6789578-Karenia_brevis.AAC.1
MVDGRKMVEGGQKIVQTVDECRTVGFNFHVHAMAFVPAILQHGTTNIEEKPPGDCKIPGDRSPCASVKHDMNHTMCCTPKFE